MSIVSLARYWRKRDWDDQEIAEFQRVRETLSQAGFAVATDRGVTDEGDPWFIFLREGSDEVIAHFARIDGQIVADSSALAAPLRGRELRGVLEQTFRQYALLPVGTGSGNSLLLHPAALLTAFVATAFLQLEHGEQKLALSASGALGLAAAGGAGDHGDAAGGAAADGIAAHAGDAGADGLKALLARLPGLFGAGPAPANAPARAVTVSDGVTTSDSTTAHSVMLTTLVAALGALQTVDVAAAEPAADTDGGGAGDVGGVPIMYAAELARARTTGPDAYPLAKAARAESPDGGAPDLAASRDTASTAGHGDAAPTGGSGTGAADPDRAERPSVLSDGERMPITLAANAVEPAPPAAAETTPDEPVGPLATEAASGAAGDAASGSGAGSGGFDPSDLLGPGAAPAERQRDGASSGGSGGDADIRPHLDTLLFDGGDADDPALADTHAYLDNARDGAQAVAPDADTTLSQLARAFNYGEDEPLDFAIFESGRVPYLGFQFSPEVVFLKARVLDTTEITLDGPTRSIDLADGGAVTLLGVVTLAEDASIDGV